MSEDTVSYATSLLFIIMKKLRVVFFHILAVVLYARIIYPQAYEGESCTGKGDPALKQLLKAGIIPLLAINDRSFISTYEKWSSSNLAPDVKKPVKNPDEEDYEYAERLDRWTCLYTPFSAFDGNPKTAWVEGEEGDGIGEVLVARINVRHPVEIWAGIGASEELFRANNRPRQIRVYALAGKGSDANRGAQYSYTQYTDIRIIGSHVVMLKDLNGYQPLPLPVIKNVEEQEETFIAIEILSVYRGKRYRDTGISEIRNR